ncbi:hypothetical protein DWX69_15075 [Thomasclavelia ramosa]|uniref:hypothetical protein n=1 Tax=Thomasclavelia ramosa TaxID=1547 RepID=UPI000E5155F5|nr:hypothetical protein [Thomasclavelia ramosa]RGS84837.1 hypothetical protein DWX69_15075 [Thomasclavelia ramosa]
MIKEKELLEDINSYIDQYRSELAKQQVKSILDNLSFIYYKTKSLIIELEGVENSHEKTITIIKNYLEYLKDFKLPDMNESNWKPIGKPVWWIDLVYFLNRPGNEFEVELDDLIKKIKNSYKKGR